MRKSACAPARYGTDARDMPRRAIDLEDEGTKESEYSHDMTSSKSGLTFKGLFKCVYCKDMQADF